MNNLTNNEGFQIINMDVEYANQAMETLPVGYIDKTICGCGFTTVAIENNEDCVIAVPSISLIDNKVSQYNENDKGIVLFPVKGGVTTAEVNGYVLQCVSEGRPIKIITTYDSLYKCEEILDSYSTVKLIVDESNKLLSSAYLKASNTTGVDAITRVFNIANVYRERVTFISATPIPLKYLPEWVSTLPRYKYLWSNTVKTKPHLLKRAFPNAALCNEIIGQLETNGVVNIGGISAKKLIIFINSVSGIGSIAKKCNLNPNDVAYISADNVTNDSVLKKYNRLTNPKQLPKYTFVTSTGFEGIDLYDEDAVSVVISNTSKQHSMIDTMTDLKQATSRQRVKSNVNYDKFIFIYDQTDMDKTEQQLIGALEVQRDLTKTTIQGINENLKKADTKEGIDVFLSKNKGVAIYATIQGNNCDMNENLFNADMYFILEMRKVYKEGFDMRGAIDNSVSIKAEKQTYVAPNLSDLSYAKCLGAFNKEVKNRLEEGMEATNAQLREAIVKSNRTKLAYLSTKPEYVKVLEELYVVAGITMNTYRLAVSTLTEYKEGTGKEIKDIVQNEFKEGTDYTREEIKTKLTMIYQKLGIKRTAKHTDVLEFFTGKEKRLKSSGIRGVSLIKKISKLPR